MSVLVVDDSRTMRRIVARTLRQAGYGGHEVLEAPDGASALRAVAERSPDVVLSDWNMPGLSGLELLAALRQAGSTVPVGLVTSEGSDRARELAAAAGASFLVAKPFTPDALAAALGPVLGPAGR